MRGHDAQHLRRDPLSRGPVHVVIGAGPAGLATAWQLQRDGHEVRVLEASAHVGGLAGSRTVAGVRVDLGSHRLHPATPPWILHELGQPAELQERRRADRIRLGDRWVPFPRTPGRMVRSLAGDLARRRAPTSSPADIARHLRRGDRTPPTFLYPRRGFGAIAEALAAQLPVDTGRRVNRVIEHHDRVIVGLSDGRLVTASHVHATVPAWQVAAWLGLHEEPHGPPPLQALVLVYLVLDRRPYTDVQAHHLPDRHVLATRVSEPTNYRDSVDDPTDRTVLCAEIPCWPGDDVWTAGAEALGARVADDLVRSGLPDPRHVDVHVERLPAVRPSATPQAVAAQARAERALTMSRRVTVLGRQGLATSHDTHHVLEMGARSARCVRPDGSFDHEAWASVRDGFRSLVASD